MTSRDSLVFHVRDAKRDLAKIDGVKQISWSSKNTPKQHNEDIIYKGSQMLASGQRLAVHNTYL